MDSSSLHPLQGAKTVKEHTTLLQQSNTLSKDFELMNMTQQRRKSTLTPSRKNDGGAATNNHSTGSRKNGAIRSRSSANRYSDLEKQEDHQEIKQELQLEEDGDGDSTQRNKVKYFAVQINSPLEENKKQIVEHYHIPNIVNVKGEALTAKKSDNTSNDIEDFDAALQDKA